MQATINVSGQTFNALVIENFILRQPSSVKEVSDYITYYTLIYIYIIYSKERTDRRTGILEMRRGCGRTASEGALWTQDFRAQHSVCAVLRHQIISSRKS
jgi:hypothetical protein